MTGTFYAPTGRWILRAWSFLAFSINSVYTSSRLGGQAESGTAGPRLRPSWRSHWPISTCSGLSLHPHWLPDSTLSGSQASPDVVTHVGRQLSDCRSHCRGSVSCIWIQTAQDREGALPPQPPYTRGRPAAHCLRGCKLLAHSFPHLQM